MQLCLVWQFIYCYAECLYAECRYAECRGALFVQAKYNQFCLRFLHQNYASVNATLKAKINFRPDERFLPDSPRPWPSTRP